MLVTMKTQSFHITDPLGDEFGGDQRIAIQNTSNIENVSLS